jgi:hypothetical protein
MGSIAARFPADGYYRVRKGSMKNPRGVMVRSSALRLEGIRRRFLMKKVQALWVVIPFLPVLALASNAQGPNTRRHCGDAYENNDSRSRSADLGTITDCDSDLGSLTATLGPFDEDWYGFRIESELLCSLDGPRVDLVFPRATRYLSETYFVTVEVRCAGDPDLQSDPVSGATTGGPLSISVPGEPCPGFDNELDVTVRIRRSTRSLGCARYRMSWSDGA